MAESADDLKPSEALCNLLRERMGRRIGAGLPSDPGPDLHTLDTAIRCLVEMAFDVSIFRSVVTYAQAAHDASEPGADQLVKATRLVTPFLEAAAAPLLRAVVEVYRAHTRLMGLLVDMPLTKHGKGAVSAKHGKHVPVLTGVAGVLRVLSKRAEPDAAVWAQEVHDYLLRAEDALGENWSLDQALITRMIDGEMKRARTVHGTWVKVKGGPTMAAVSLLDRLALSGRYVQAARSFFERTLGTSWQEAFLLPNLCYSKDDRDIRLLEQAMWSLDFPESEVNSVVYLLKALRADSATSPVPA